MNFDQLLNQEIKVSLKNAFFYRGRLETIDDELLVLIDTKTHNRVFLRQTEIACVERLRGDYEL